MSKKTVAVIFGGVSSEHDISCISAHTVIENIDRDLYEVIMIGITKTGDWLLVNDLEAVSDGSWTNGKEMAVILPDRSFDGILIKNESGYREVHIDVAFPVLHGLNGEDGTIQGLFEMSGIPYVGCGVLASAAGMDKLTTKRVVAPLNIKQAGYVAVHYNHLYNFDETADEVESRFPYPVFVKPSNAGSSKGVSKAVNREALRVAIDEAAKHDSRILIEETIVGREIECAVLGGEKVQATGVGEILAAADFYDFDAKYNNAESKTVIDPELPEGVRDKIREDAMAIFKALDGFGLSRVDFFVTNDTHEVVFNEINTLPGFTNISMYPMLWAACGLEKKELITKLIEMAPERRMCFNAVK